MAAQRPCGCRPTRARSACAPPTVTLLRLGGGRHPLRGLLRGRHPASAGGRTATAAAALLHHAVDLVQVQSAIKCIFIILVCVGAHWYPPWCCRLRCARRPVLLWRLLTWWRAGRLCVLLLAWWRAGRPAGSTQQNKNSASHHAFV